jgi:hypothetical protein
LEILINTFRNVYIYFALLVPLTILGFWPTFFAIFDNLPPKVTPVIHAHALLMFVWLFMLIAQAWFIRTKRFRPHQWVGRASYVIAPLIILLGLATFHEALNRTPGGVPMDGPVGSRIGVFGFGQMLAFAVSWGLAIAYRKQTRHHVRFIISTTFAIAPAVVIRICAFPVFRFETEGAIVAATCCVISLPLLVLIAIDWCMGVKRSAYWVVTIVLSVMHLGYWTYAKTDGWLTYCQWFADLPPWKS